MKKNILNFLIIILTIALIVVLSMIIIKYTKNYLNEKDVEETLAIIESEFDKITNNEINDKDEENKKDLLDVNYKGYKIEGIIEIPKIGIKYPIINETTDEAMLISITKFWGPQPNEIGNYIVAGHNNRDGTMFGKTKYLEIGDIIKLTNLKNETIEYEVFNIYSIDPNDLSIIESVDKKSREITLITCTNGHINRLVTRAREIKTNINF